MIVIPLKPDPDTLKRTLKREYYYKTVLSVVKLTDYNVVFAKI